MKLRGHHLFCAALYSGHGYNQEFADQMEFLLSAMKAGEPVQLTIGADELCAACPNRTETGGCNLGTMNAQDRDTAALRVLGLQPGESITWKEAQRRLSQITQLEFQAVCSDCRWQKSGLCSFALLQERSKELTCN